MSYHFTAIRIVIIKTNKQTINKEVLVRMWRNWDPHALVVGMSIGAAAMEKSKFSKNQNRITI